MKGRVKNGQVELGIRERKPVELCYNQWKSFPELLDIMTRGGESVLWIDANVCGDATVTLQRQPIGQPAISRSEIKDVERPLTRQLRQQALFQVLVALATNRPLAGVLPGKVRIRQCEVV